VKDPSIPAASVLIPAYQEAAVIARCLNALLADAAPGEFEIVVVANGCTDGTARIARSFEPRVRVVELPVGSKSLALNEGERELHHFPRLYLDADVELDSQAARAIATALATDQPVIATPRRTLQVAEATLPTRWYFRTWEALQEARRETIGTGAYALNQAGRRRFTTFPESIGDDTFVHSLFRSSERRIVNDTVKVWPPQRLREVVAVRTRVALGNMTTPPGPGTRDRPSAWGQLLRLLSRPAAAAGLPLYIAVTLQIQFRARSRLRTGDLAWTRAERRVP
jgi:glycosyltransferase involved in cell wall biosynthesis